MTGNPHWRCSTKSWRMAALSTCRTSAAHHHHHHHHRARCRPVLLIGGGTAPCVRRLLTGGRDAWIRRGGAASTRRTCTSPPRDSRTAGSYPRSRLTGLGLFFRSFSEIESNLRTGEVPGTGDTGREHKSGGGGCGRGDVSEIGMQLVAFFFSFIGACGLLVSPSCLVHPKN